ncbi:ATP-dependent RNA helicase TDRD9 [Ixodes scapularis]|uniref:ATP-dependent RNA helicase TDRD9 n=1 Tax=Ixodes scapularis TaxID=6945 RepID=UPI001C394324|nr:ATP-dependent RNA helicase TDRD9 [Ixodes scapularis]XP_029835090.3 ATP-dependent RNA helicase TDRD9 [Ixodes scapularis]
MSRTAADLTLSDILTVFSASKPASKVASNQRLFQDHQPTAEEARALVMPQRQISSGTDYVKHYQEKELQALKRTESEAAEPDALAPLSTMGAGVDRVTLAAEQAPLGDLQAESSQQVYSNYFQGRPFLHNQDLPIASCKDQLIKMVETYPVVVVQGATGCGKTTQVPQYLLDHFASKGQHCNIVVTQPRRIAAISVARRVCQERGWSLGTVVGYQVGMDNQTSEDTRLAYVTTGVLLEKLIGQKDMNQFTHVIIDEVHERDQQTDFVLLVVRKFLRSNSRTVKVILMSATIDVTYFAEYFSTSFFNKLEPAPVVEIPGKMMAVKEYYINSLRTLGEIPQFDENDPSIPLESFVLAHRLVKAFDKLEVSEQTDGTPTERFAPVRGTVLVFLPGYEEISTLTDMLRDDGVSLRWTVLPLHSTVTQQEQQSVFRPPERGYRKIILSTNIAESSITVPDIKYVIDFCLTKSLVCDPDTKYSCLKMEWASKANCKQRQGRAGRVSEGRLYRMIPEDFYNNVLPSYGIPEMKRCPLELTVLKVKKLDLDEPKAMLALCLDPPDLGDIERAILVLKEVSALTMGAMGSFSPYDGDLTFVGRVMAQLPLDVRISKMIILGFVFDCLEDCIIIAACLSVQSMFSRPFQKLIEAYKSRLAWADGSFSDCLAMLQAYKLWQKFKLEGAFSRRNGVDERAWARQNFLQYKRLVEIERLVDELKKRLVTFNIRTDPRPNIRGVDDNEHLVILRLVICGAFYPHYFTQESLNEADCFKGLVTDPLCSVTVSGIPQNQGILYDHALRRMFSCCSEHMKIYFEESKATIEFLRKSSSVGILPAVYTAVKMRQLRIPLELSLFRPEDAKEKLERLRRLQEDNAGNKLKTNRMVVVPGISSLKTVPLPSTNQMTINIYLTEVVTCGHFYAHYSDPAYEAAEQHMTLAINHNGGKHLKPITSELRLEMLVLAPFKGAYYRARIESLGQNNKASVFFVDYGNRLILDASLLREIDPDTLFDTLITPAQAFQCKLAEIKPSALACSKEQWTNRAKDVFERLVSGKELVARVYSVVDEVVRVHLLVRDGHLHVNVNEELVRLGIADRCEESFLSKKNHQLRERVESYHQSVTDSTEAVQDGCEEVDTCRLNFGPPQMSARKVRLNGPHSPLEVRLSGMTRVCSQRGVRVERTSVNSVLLESEPQRPHPRMLVACHVGQSATSDHVTLRSTTLLPAIPGLHCLMPLLFAPHVEFRADPEKTEYIGALCGLGFEDHSGLALYADHDMELTFDTTFTQDDLFLVNRVRMMINLVLKADPGMAVISWSGSGLARVQARAREFLFELIMKKLEPREPRVFPRRYQWNLIRDDCRLRPTVSGEEDLPATVLPLHDGICLEPSSDMLRTVHERLQELHMQASSDRTSERQLVRCPVCDVAFLNPFDIHQHLRTKTHRDKEMEIQTLYEESLQRRRTGP